VGWLVQTVVQTHAELLKLPNLRPGKAINQLLGNLVSVCSEIHDRDIVEKVTHPSHHPTHKPNIALTKETKKKVLSHPSINPLLPSLRRICASAESCLELHWAEHILAGDPTQEDVLARLRSFPYYDNYEELTRLELCAILSATKTAPRRVAFIGSGPLPLTSLCLLQALKESKRGGGGLVPRMSSASVSGGSSAGEGVEDKDEKAEEESVVVLNVDYDEAAIAASLSLCLALGETGRGMEFICAEATSAEKDLAEFDVVYLAALVGMSQGDKEGIVLQVVDRMRPGALLVVRSSWGLRTCLYPEVDLATEALLKRLEPCVVVHPYGQVVNSVIVARVKA
jgi:hypothetical protein